MQEPFTGRDLLIFLALDDVFRSLGVFGGEIAVVVWVRIASLNQAHLGVKHEHELHQMESVIDCR